MSSTMSWPRVATTSATTAASWPRRSCRCYDMSFTTEVKKELNRVARRRHCCRTAELAAFFRAAGSFHIKARGEFGLHASFGLSATARTAISLVRSFDLPLEVRVFEENRLGPHKRYEIHLEGGARLVQFLNEIGVLSDSMSLQEKMPPRIIRKSCCKSSFLRGAFIASGSVSEPGTCLLYTSDAA